MDKLSLAKVKHDEAISMLKNTGQKVCLVVAKHRMDDVARPKGIHFSHILLFE